MALFSLTDRHDTDIRVFRVDLQPNGVVLAYVRELRVGMDDVFHILRGKPVDGGYEFNGGYTAEHQKRISDGVCGILKRTKK